MPCVPHAVAELHPRLTFEAKASQIHSHQQGGQWKGQAGPPLPDSLESARLPASPSSPSGVEECPASSPGCAPRPWLRAQLLTVALLSEKAAQDEVHHAGGLVRAPPQRVH